MILLALRALAFVSLCLAGMKFLRPSTFYLSSAKSTPTLVLAQSNFEHRPFDLRQTTAGDPFLTCTSADRWPPCSPKSIQLVSKL